jgi:hypothetical protein
VLLATAASHADLSWDDRLFAAALARRGAVARAAVWNDPAVDWRVQSVVVRSTWDYYRHPDEFLAWAARVAEGALLQNALPVISWNAHKEYLTRLHANGISIIETVFIPARRSVGNAAGETSSSSQPSPRRPTRPNASTLATAYRPKSIWIASCRPPM